MNYAPIAVIIVIGGAAIWWNVSAKNWFTGPRRTVDDPVVPDVEKAS